MKLELGSGENPSSGYDSIDRIEKLNSLYCFDIEENIPWPIESNKYDEVLAIHVMEHFNLSKAKLIFDETLRVLKPGGIFKVHVPNGELICKAYLSKTDKRICLDPIYGGESNSKEEYSFAHKILYDKVLLSEVFLNSGFTNIKDFRNDISDRHDQFWEKHLNGRISLKISGVK